MPKDLVRYSFLILVVLAVIAVAFLVSLFLFYELKITEKFIAPIVSIIVAAMSGCFALVTALLSKKLGIKARDESVVYYGQEVVLKAYAGEYVVLEGDERTLKAAEKNIRRAERFVIAESLSPYGKPKDKPVQYLDRVIFRRVGHKGFIAADESQDYSPLCIVRYDTISLEYFTLERTENDIRRTNDAIVRFGWGIHLKRHDDDWVWYDKENTQILYSTLTDFQPDTYESFSLENPKSSFIERIIPNPILPSFIVGVLCGTLLALLPLYLF
jgi:hypothetical protein